MSGAPRVAVHVVGNACIDMTWAVDRFPAVGETVASVAVDEDLGGKGLNQAVAAARGGARVRLWAAVGTDGAADRIRSRLVAEGIGTDTLTAFDGPTDLSTILVDKVGDNMIVSRIACAAAFDPLREDALAGAIAPGDFVVMQGNLAPDVTEACLAHAKASGARTVLNPSPIARVAAMPWPLVDWAILNRGEAETLTEKADPHQAARRLLAMGVGAVVVTLGAEGALLATAGEAHAVEAQGMPVVGTAGAGDVVCGLFAGLVSSGLPALAALGVAVAAASLSVSRPGTLSACPSRVEIDALRHSALVLR